MVNSSESMTKQGKTYQATTESLFTDVTLCLLDDTAFIYLE
ncbi:hypothetical protein [Shewanella surugensis]|nr:hypothetical protein [Shewanella surugensis]